MTVSLIITGTGEWARYTLPFITSIHEYCTGIHTVCVDNGSQYPALDLPDFEMVRTEKVLPYPAVINVGIRAHRADWYFYCNNDMLIKKPLHAWQWDALDQDSLYSWIMVSKATVGFEYLESFSMFVPHRIWEAIGEFDENFAPMWFEGADYCYRAQKAGFKLAKPLDRDEWGVYHLENERDRERKEYMRQNMAARRRNREYLWRKHGIK